MKGATWKAALIGAAAAVITVAQPAAADEQLALRRVLLSSGGVGYFEYEARVSGEANLPLSVRLDQVDDVLKSVVVYDDQGGAGEVTLPGKSAAGEAFRDLPFDPAALGSEPVLLEALRGAEVIVTGADGHVDTGKILSVTTETVELPDHRGTVTRHRLALAREGTVTTIILEDVDSVRFVDPTLRAQLDAALDALLEQTDRGRRTLTVHAGGAGARTVRVGYVVAVPLWKSTYRLTLPAPPRQSKASLVGLAVVENQSGTAWNDVDLTLVSGNPVTFHQALYQAYYVDRPEIPVEVVGRVLPRLDEGAVAVAAKHDHEAPAYAAGLGFGGGGGGGRGGGEAMAAPSAATSWFGPTMPPAPAAPPKVESTEEVTQVVFHLASRVTLAAGEDALIPIIDRPIPAERVSVYQPDVDVNNPISSVQLTNDTDTGLPPGVITTYERADNGTITYLGDARLATLPAGERRLVSFGVDQKVRIDRQEHDAQLITVAAISGGTLRLTRIVRHTTDYTIAGAAREPRTVILEEPRIDDYELAPLTGATAESTPDHYRVRVEVPVGGTVHLAVTQQKPVEERIGIAELSSAALATYVSSGEIPTAVREALTRIAALRATVDEKQAAVNDVQTQINQITTEQARIRENLKVVPAGTELHQRYLTSLSQQEDRLAALQTQLTDARRAHEAAKKALADAIRMLSV
ncbi:MAG: DUF4139 domain-containing protein [Minicystis sp.]